MNIKSAITRGVRQIWDRAYHLLDSLYVPCDRKHVRRTRNIRLIPTERNRRGGKHAYSEWAHVIGIFQTLMFLNLHKKQGNTILDIGCGTGLLGIAAEPFLGHDGKYIGLDVIEEDIEFCRGHYSSTNFDFIHFNVNNPAYAPAQKGTESKWPFESESFDLATALSVWTHLNEEDALFYFKEVRRVLNPDGIAIVTFFLLDEMYQGSQYKVEEGRQVSYDIARPMGF